ncbi:hypothetical protein Tco_0740058, partial [Tanacetum coccineum]
MAGLKFVDSHNMVVYLEKSTENADFAKIVEFLNANPISEPTTLVADEAVHEERGDSMERVATTATSLDAEQDSGGRPRRQETMGDRPAQTRIELKELMEIYTKLSKRVLDLEKAKTAQAKEIASLKKRVKKLETKRRSRTPGMNLFKIGTSRRRSLGEEDASKQGRNLKQRSIFAESNVDEDLDAVIDEAIEHVYKADKDVKGDAEQVISATADEVSTRDAVNTASTKVNTASAPVTTAGISVTTAEPITPPTITT